MIVFALQKYTKFWNYTHLYYMIIALYTNVNALPFVHFGRDNSIHNYNLIFKDSQPVHIEKCPMANSHLIDLHNLREPMKLIHQNSHLQTWYP